MVAVTRRLKDVAMAHRLVDHKGNCRFVHGHNYRVELTIQAPTLDDEGMVIDFGAFKPLDELLQSEFDHKLCLSGKDQIFNVTVDMLCKEGLDSRIVSVPFNPTVENLASYWMLLLKRKLSEILPESRRNLVSISKIKVWETENSWVDIESTF